MLRCRGGLDQCACAKGIVNIEVQVNVVRNCFKLRKEAAAGLVTHSWGIVCSESRPWNPACTPQV